MLTDEKIDQIAQKYSRLIVDAFDCLRIREAG